MFIISFYSVCLCVFEVTESRTYCKWDSVYSWCRFSRFQDFH